jgi:2Fe-2S ferredoxin
MPTVYLVAPDGARTAVPARSGQSLMRAATQAGVDGIAADCGGGCTCATCHVIVDEVWLQQLPPPGDDEAAMLEMTASPRESGSRLSCCLVLDASLDGLTARLPERQY